MSIRNIKIFFIFFAALLIPALGNAAENSNATLWLSSKTNFSINKILENISPADGLPGSVIASPSRSAPDYYYHWVRDAALTMTALIDTYHGSADNKKKLEIRRAVADYIEFSHHIQNTNLNPGEPKFYVNGNVYQGPWGRPQNDGPALRAVSLIHWANILLAEGDDAIVRQKLYDSRLPSESLIKKDLEYISHHWKDPSFDLWEEVKGTHFYTLMVIRRALLEGSALAYQLDDAGAGKWYLLQAKEIEIELEHFWDEKKGYISATINRTDGINYKNSNLDTSVILGLLHGNMNDGFLAWNHPRVQSTMKKLVAVFAELYPINHRSEIPGTAIGRYPEDRYGGENFDGGNPWPLATLAMAQALYEYADLFVERVKYHAYRDGSMDEQINRYTGYMTSARHLTWNYAALLTTRDAALRR
jgi:glucoamylase